MTRSSPIIDFPSAPKSEIIIKEEPKPVAKAVSIAQQRFPSFLQEETFQTTQIKKLHPRLRELVHMLEYARPDGSDTEEHFISTYLDTLPGMTKDAFGNRICKVGREQPTIAYSCHTDTVHCDEGLQAIEIDKHGLIGLDYNSAANCLGADDTAGVWLMRRLILAGKPGLYIFHRGEESGGRGSRWIAKNTPELVNGIQAMIALDRYGYTSVITEQSTGVTASNRFAKSLAEQLNNCGHGAKFEPDDGGIFTDSAFYNHLIPECTNLSVGYFSQHSRKETLDYEFTDQVLIALLKLDYSRLVIARDPKAEDTSWRNRYSYGTHYAPWENDPVDDYYHEQWNEKAKDYARDRAGDLDGLGSGSIYSDRELVELIRKNPEAAARLLGYWDLTADDMYEAMRDL